MNIISNNNFFVSCYLSNLFSGESLCIDWVWQCQELKLIEKLVKSQNNLFQQHHQQLVLFASISSC